MSSASVLDWLGTMAEKYGFAGDDEVKAAKSAPGNAPGGGGAATCEAVRPSEMISGASGVQYSTGENTYEGMEEGGDFADKARENARDNDHDSVYSSYKDGANPMQSPNLASGAFALRYGIGFLCANYKSWNDLDDIKDLSKPRSAYLAAFKGMNKTRQYKDPKSADIEKAIARWINTLAKDLKGCGTGELVISFQGHGENGSIYGVDEKEINSARMLAFSKAAEKKRISLTWMLDACFSGNAVADFQDHAGDAVDKGLNGKGTSKEAEALKDQMAHARNLILTSREIGRYGDELHVVVSDIEANNTTDDWDEAIKVNTKIIRTAEQMLTQIEYNFNFGNRPEMKLDRIIAFLDNLIAYLNTIQPYTCFDYSAWTGAIGRCQDEISNGANHIIALINKDMKALKK